MAGWAIVSIDEQGIILSVDKACCSLLGYTLDELVGERVEKIVPAPYKEQHSTYMRQYLKTGIKRIIGKAPRTVEAVTKKGKFLAVSLHVTETILPASGERRFLGVLQPCEENCSVVTVSSTSGEIISVANPRALGFASAAHLAGKHFDTLLPKDYKGRSREFLEHSAPERPSTRSVPLITGTGTIVCASLLVSEMSFGELKMYRAEISVVDPNIQLMFSVSADGIIASANHNFLHTILGYQNEQVCGMPWNELVPGSFENGVLRIPIGRRVDREARHADGAVLEAAVTVHSFQTPSGESHYSIRLSRRCDSNSSTLSGASDDSLHLHGDDPVTVGSYELGQELGRGMYGRVMTGCHLETKEMVAIKLIYIRNNKNADVLAKRARREIAINKRLDHPNIARLIEVHDSEAYLALVLEYITGGSMSTRLAASGTMSETECSYFLKQVASALAYIHALGIVHRDIKHSNVMVVPPKVIAHPGAPWVGATAKLIDFGLSTYSEEGAFLQSYCGTPAFAAPEMLRGEDYSGSPVDMWSLGVCVYKSLTSHFPFDSVSQIMGGKLDYPVALSPSCTDMLSRLLQLDPELRLSAEQLLLHPHLSNPSHFRRDVWKEEEDVEDIMEVACEVSDMPPTKKPKKG